MIGVAAALLCGCGGLQPALVAADAGRSFSSTPRTSPCPCLYVTNANDNAVTVYPLVATGNVKPIQDIRGVKTGLHHPRDVAVDKKGNIYIANASPASVTVYAAGATGNVEPIKTISGHSTELSLPSGIAVDPKHGDIYVSNTAGGPIKIGSVTVYAPGASGDVPPTGVIQGPNTRLEHPNSLALDASGNIAVTNALVFYPGWVTFYSAGSRGNVAPVRTIQGARTKIGWPTQIAIDSNLDAYVANHDGSNLTVYAPGANGNVAPIRNVHGRRTRLISPFGVAADSSGNIYAAGGVAARSRITVYAAGSNRNAHPIRAVAGDHTGLDSPQGIAIH